MPKIAPQLTVRQVDSLRSPGKFAVGGVDGLHLRVTNTGARAWMLRIVVGTRRRDIGLGRYPEVSLAEAREKARKIRSDVRAGIEPMAPSRLNAALIKARQANQRTFQQCANAYIASKAAEWRGPRHRKQWEQMLAVYAFPTLGQMLVQDIELKHILAILEPIWATKTETATKLLTRIRAVLSYAIVAGYRQGENPALWKDHLDKLLPLPGKVRTVQHQPAMPMEEVHAFMQILRTKRGISHRALEFAILTAARSGEVRGATWDEIDFDAKVWTIPASRMKAAREHRVPLAKQAIDLLRAIPRIEGSPYVFTAPHGGMLSNALNVIMKKMKLDFVPHGFRSTFRDWAGERTNYPRELAEQALAHATGNAVEQAYRRGDSLEKRRKMMQAWADFIDLPPATATVTPINKIA